MVAQQSVKLKKSKRKSSPKKKPEPKKPMLLFNLWTAHPFFDKWNPESEVMASVILGIMFSFIGAVLLFSFTPITWQMYVITWVILLELLFWTHKPRPKNKHPINNVVMRTIWAKMRHGFLATSLIGLASLLVLGIWEVLKVLIESYMYVVWFIVIVVLVGLIGYAWITLNSLKYETKD